VILHYANTEIRAVGRVQAAAEASSRPDPEADQAWGDEGRRAEVAYRDIEPRIGLSEIPQSWRQKERGVFNSDGGVGQGYLFAISDEFARKLDNHHPQLNLATDVDFVVMPPAESVSPSATFDVENLRAACVDRELILEGETYATVLAAIESGKHVILTGPPGTAKTTLAEIVADLARRAGRCAGHLLTTATADWTTYETIGGLKPDRGGGLSFAPGHFLEAISKNQWLVIDELNRSNFDRAFGQLFTVLSGQPVELPYERTSGEGRLVLLPEGARHSGLGDTLVIPRTWRVIATMNVFDKSLLFEMSFALMRRFAFIEVPSPPEQVFHTLIDREATPDGTAADMAKKFLSLRRFKDLGPAIFMDLARFFRARRELASSETEGALAFEGFYAFLLPQFEGIELVVGEALYKEVRKLVGSDRAERLRRTLNAVLGLELSAASEASEVDEQEHLEGPTQT
jgi:MoxR-like ATPase